VVGGGGGGIFRKLVPVAVVRKGKFNVFVVKKSPGIEQIAGQLPFRLLFLYILFTIWIGAIKSKRYRLTQLLLLYIT